MRLWLQVARLFPIAAVLTLAVADLRADVVEQIHMAEVTTTPVSRLTISSKFAKPIGSITVTAELDDARTRFKSLEVSYGDRLKANAARSLLSCFDNPDIWSLTFQHAGYQRAFVEHPHDWYRGWWTAVSFNSYPAGAEQLVTIVIIDGEVRRAEIRTAGNLTTTLEPDAYCRALTP